MRHIVLVNPGIRPSCQHWHVSTSEVATLGLLQFDGLEQRLEVSGTEALMVASLNDFDEERGSVLERLREDLQEVALLVIVNQNVELPDVLEVLLNLRAHLLQVREQVVVVGVRNRQELAAARSHSLDRVQDVVCAQGNVLYTGASVEIDVLLNLRFSLTLGRFVDRHLDVLVEVGDHDGSQRRVLSVQHLVIDGPEAMEVEHLLVPAGRGLHLTIGLVADAVVNKLQLRLRNQLVNGLFLRMLAEAWQEQTLIVDTLHESVRRVTVGANRSHHDRAMLILEGLRLSDRSSATLDGLLVDARGIIDMEGNVLDAITVLRVMGIEFLVACGIERRSERELDLAIMDNMGGPLSVASLEASVGKILEAEACTVEGSGLLGITNPEGNVIEGMEHTNFGALSRLSVVNHLRLFFLFVNLKL